MMNAILDTRPYDEGDHTVGNRQKRPPLVLRDASNNNNNRQPSTASTAKTTKKNNEANSRPPAPALNEANFASTTTVSHDDHIESDDAKTKFDAVAATRLSVPLDDDDSLADEYQAWSLEDFVIGRKLGSGGAATVYEAREVQSGHHVALKVQKENDGLAASEIDIHGCVHQNAHIVGYYDHFYANCPLGDSTKEDDDGGGERYVYMILELCGGGSLYDVVRQQPQCRVHNERQAATWIQGAMQALAYLHLHDIVHGDVKTANFLVCHDDETDRRVVKLADFGFAVRLDEVDTEVEGGSMLYMAPEHLMAWRDGLDCDLLDEKVDVYGLGVVLFELLVGEVPYVVLEDYSDDEDRAVTLADLVSCWQDCDYKPHIIDLPALDEGTQLAEPVFPEFVSDQAQDLLRALLHTDPHSRISLEEALSHPWIQMNTGE